MNLFKQTTPEKAWELVERLESKLALAVSEVEVAQKECGAALLAAEEGDTKATSQQRENSRKRLSKAKSDVVELQLAILGAKDRHQEALKRFEEDWENRQWKQVEDLSKERAALAQEIEHEAALLVEKYQRLIQVSSEMHDAAPKKEATLTDSILSPSHVETCLRMHLHKAGLDWAFSWPWGKNAIIPLSERVAEGNGWILSRKGKVVASKPQPGA